MSQPSTLRLDYEAFSEQPLTGPRSVGLWNYCRDVSTEALMVAYQIDDQEDKIVDLTQERFPRELREALLDPKVQKWAFNAGFERVFTRMCLRIETPYEGWRCAMALANLQSFSGDLGTIASAMGIEEDKVKDKEGKRLIQLFSVPQIITRKNSLYRRNRNSDPDDWQLFLDYCAQDLVAEREIAFKLSRFQIDPLDWEAYEIDQQINDEGFPVNRQFVVNADRMAIRRKAELREIMQDLTRLQNPNSAAQILPWLQQRGYPFHDLQKNTVKNVLTRLGADMEKLDDSKRSAEADIVMEDEAVRALWLRQQASRTSVRKYPAILQRLAEDDRLRHCFQFAGAVRTGRWAGRGPQPHNLTHTPKELEVEGDDTGKLDAVTTAMVAADFDTLSLLFAEPMTALAGCVRSSFQAPKGFEFGVSDLSSIESAVIAWITGCKRMLKVFAEKRDPYKDFAVELYHVMYEEVTSLQRKVCKPAVLGCGYRLGGGDMRDGKRTGLWAYAENMGVNLERDEAHSHVSVFRKIYFEIPLGWKDCEIGVEEALKGRPSFRLGGKVYFSKEGPYLTITLPSDRKLYYYKPRMVSRTFEGRDGPYERTVFSYMGKHQTTGQWVRVYSNGGKIIENIVQAIARDILRAGIVAAHKEGFKIVAHVHDEIVALTRKGDNFFTLDRLRECMTRDLGWTKGLPLGAAGYVGEIYRKD